jgi:hypothetical protein
VKLSRPDLSAYAVVALCVVAITVLIGLGKTPPDFLQYIALTALGVGGGVALQGAGGTTTPATEPVTPAPLPVPAPQTLAASYPPVLGTTSDPAATGVMRLATHSPS